MRIEVEIKRGLSPIIVMTQIIGSGEKKISGLNKIRNIQFISTFLTIFLIAFSCTVQAEGFDCEQSQLGIQKTICSDKELSYYDILINVAYERALQTAKNTSVLKQKQRKWILYRNACKDIACMKDLYTQQLEWISKQPRKPVYYKQVMSKDNRVCSVALKAFNQDIELEYPNPPWNVWRHPVEHQAYIPKSIAPSWHRFDEAGRKWTTDVDLDWDGEKDNLVKYVAVGGLTGDNEKYSSSLSVNNSEPVFLINGGIYWHRLSFDRSYPSGSFARTQYDRIGDRSVKNGEIITSSFHDVVILHDRAYLTFVSENMGDGFIEDWSQRKWRVVSRYLGSASAVVDDNFDNNILEDVCYFVLTRN